MLSLQIVDHINALLVPLAEDGVLQRVTDRLGKIYRRAVPAGCKQLDLSDGSQVIGAFTPWRDLVAMGLTELRDIQPRHVFNAVSELQEAGRAFMQAARSPSEEEHVLALLEELSDFTTSYETALQVQKNSNSLPLLATADRLAYSLATTRDLLRLVRDALTEDAVPNEATDVERFSLILFSDQSFTGFVTKLAAVERIYRELLGIVAGAEHSEPARIIKVESGSIWLDILGVPRVVKLLADLIERAVEYIHRNYTREGKITSLPRKVDAVDAVLNLRSRLKAEGIDVAAADEILTKATVKIASDLNVLLGGEPRIEVNRRQYSVGLAMEQKFIAESRVRQIEAGDPPLTNESGGA